MGSIYGIRGMTVIARRKGRGAPAQRPAANGHDATPPPEAAEPGDLVVDFSLMTGGARPN